MPAHCYLVDRVRGEPAAGRIEPNTQSNLRKGRSKFRRSASDAWRGPSRTRLFFSSG